MASGKPLSLKKKKYVKGLVEGKTKKQAAIDAGYSVNTAENAKAVIETPDVRAAFRDVIRKHVPMDKVGLRIAEGLDAMETKFATWEGKITDSSDVIAWTERRAYAELAAQWGGYFVPKSEIEVSTPIGEMSTEQLLARAAQLAQQIKGNGGAAERPQG